MNLFDLHGKNALVTGASSGIGKQVALAYAQAGAAVAIAARHQEPLQELAAEIVAGGGTAVSDHLRCHAARIGGHHAEPSQRRVGRDRHRGMQRRDHHPRTACWTCRWRSSRASRTPMSTVSSSPRRPRPRPWSRGNVPEPSSPRHRYGRLHRQHPAAGRPLLRLEGSGHSPTKAWPGNSRPTTSGSTASARATSSPNWWSPHAEYHPLWEPEHPARTLGPARGTRRPIPLSRERRVELHDRFRHRDPRRLHLLVSGRRRLSVCRCSRSPCGPNIMIASTGSSSTPNQCGVHVENSTASPGLMVKSRSPRTSRNRPDST